MNDKETPTRSKRRRAEPTPAQALRAAISPYIAIPRLRRLVAERGDLYQALRCPTPPQDVVAMLELLGLCSNLLRATRSRAPPMPLDC